MGKVRNQVSEKTEGGLCRPECWGKGNSEGQWEGNAHFSCSLLSRVGGSSETDSG